MSFLEFEYQVWNGYVEIKRYNAIFAEFMGKDEIVVQHEIDGYPVTSIGLCAFKDCSRLRSIEIPDSVTSIGYGAFEGCCSLRSIEIPDSVTSIGYATFEGCCSLRSIEIPDSVTSIGYGAFEGCSKLSSITIPDSVTSIAEDAFSGCSSLNSIFVSKGSYAENWANANGYRDLLVINSQIN